MASYFTSIVNYSNSTIAFLILLIYSKHLKLSVISFPANLQMQRPAQHTHSSKWSYKKINFPNVDWLMAGQERSRQGARWKNEGNVEICVYVKFF